MSTAFKPQIFKELYSGAEFGPDSPSYVAVTEWNIYGEGAITFNDSYTAPAC